MCGIICVIQYYNGLDMNVMMQCLSKLTARGPDASNYKVITYDNVTIFMGFTRLAIMDTSDAGMQPFTDANGNYVICNGEIYNYKDLASKYDIDMHSDCDCEILLPLFNKIGMTDMVGFELDAEFATVIFDKNCHTIYAARDKYGVRPLYYGYNSRTGTIAFASELKALHPIMEHIEQVVPNFIYNIDLDKTDITSINRTSYFEYSHLTSDSQLTDVNYIHSQIRYLLTASVQKRLCADRPIGFLLSGGLDSSLIVSIASRILGVDKIVCFSVGLEHSPDVMAAKTVAEYLGINQHYIIPFTTDMGIASLPEVIEAIETYDITTIRASTPQYIMAKYISTHYNIKVLLSGEGSDEIHGSYRYFRDAPDPIQFHDECIRLLQELYYFDNKRTDRTMADNGLEVRVPWLDHSYVKFITSIDPTLLMYRENYMEKQIVRDSFVGYLPPEILYRSKEAFSDAVSSNEINWAKAIQNHAALIIDDDILANNTYTINKPVTKDALYFRNIFNRFYCGRDNIIPHYWLPRFQSEPVVDPSARILRSYQSNQSN